MNLLLLADHYYAIAYALERADGCWLCMDHVPCNMFIHISFLCSAKTKNVASKLDAIAQQLCRVFVEKTRKRWYQRTIQDKEIETILSLYRYNHKYDINLANEEKIKSSDPTLCLLLPTFHSHFLVQSDQGAPLSFNTGPDAIVVANGKYIKVT